MKAIDFVTDTKSQHSATRNFPLIMLTMKMTLKKHVRHIMDCKRVFSSHHLIHTLHIAFAILQEMEAQKATEAARAKEEVRVASKYKAFSCQISTFDCLPVSSSRCQKEEKAIVSSS